MQGGMLTANRYLRNYMIKTVNINGVEIYPIFKNGHSSIVNYADHNECRWLFNEECGLANPITVFLRRPFERFVSGVHTFIEHERRKMLVGVYSNTQEAKKFTAFDYEPILDGIRKRKIINEHFMPQYTWIKRLHRYFKGVLILKTVNDLRALIPNRDGPNLPPMDQDIRQMISSINPDLAYDNILYNNYIGAHMPIGKLIEGIEKNVLS